MDSSKMLGKIRAILDAAEGQEFSARKYLEAGDTEHHAEFMNGARVQREMAERLMKAYRLEQEDIIAQDPTSVEPEYLQVDLLTGVNVNSPYMQQYVNLFGAVSWHTDIRVHYAFDYSSGYKLVAHVVGYEVDIRYAEMLFTNARLVFSDKLEPTVQPHLTDQENVYRLRSAGIERVRIADMVFGNRDKTTLSRVGRMYKAECAKRGEKPALEGRGVTGKAYREQYAQGFVHTFSRRLRAARDATGEGGGALVLHGRQERVDEAFYTRFPQYRPTPSLPAGECADCKKTKHQSGKCKLHRPRPVTQKDIAAYNRYHSAAAERGRQAGADAARHVDIAPGRTGRIEDGGRGTAERMVRGEL